MPSPCPKCTSNNHILVHCVRTFHVRCFVCGTKTETYATEAEAREAWEKEKLCTRTKNLKD